MLLKNIIIGLLMLGILFANPIPPPPPDMPCEGDSDCPAEVPGLEYLCDEGVCMGTGAYLCNTDQDCMEENVGNVCMVGICGYADQPTDPEDPECVEDSDCPTEIPGPDYYCDNGECKQTNAYLCNSDEECLEANEGNQCADGTCLHVSNPPGCPIGLVILGLALFAVYKRH